MRTRRDLKYCCYPQCLKYLSQNTTEEQNNNAVLFIFNRNHLDYKILWSAKSRLGQNFVSKPLDLNKMSFLG